MAIQWLSKNNRSGSRHFSIHDFILASAFKNSNFEDADNCSDQNDQSTFIEMPKIAQNYIISQNPNQAGLSEFQKAFSAKTKKEFVFRDQQLLNEENQLQYTYDLQNQINSALDAHHGDYQSSKPSKHGSLSINTKLENAKSNQMSENSSMNQHAHHEGLEHLLSPHSHQEYIVQNFE